MFGRKQPEPVYFQWTLEFIDMVPGVSNVEIRQIVREELAEIVPVDVPDAPPKDL